MSDEDKERQVLPLVGANMLDALWYSVPWSLVLLPYLYTFWSLMGMNSISLSGLNSLVSDSLMHASCSKTLCALASVTGLHMRLPTTMAPDLLTLASTHLELILSRRVTD